MSDEEVNADQVELDVTEENCERLIKNMVDRGVLDWRTIAKEMLQALQPPQTATHVPQLDGIREIYERGDRWAPSRRWMYSQYGPCENCGRTTSLNHDHIVERDVLGLKADRLENMRFLCRRCNQSRHWDKGNILEMGTAASVMYLLFTEEPETLDELTDLGRELGLTQSNQRFEEAWALPVYLYSQGEYDLEEIHSEISEEELAQYREYYDAASGYFNELHNRLAEESEYQEAWEIKENLDKVVRGQKTKVEDRIKVANRLGIDDNGTVMEILREDTKLRNDDKRALLEAVGEFTSDEIDQVVSDNKITLFQVLNETDKEELLQEIDERLSELQSEYLDIETEEQESLSTFRD
ncbi:HNH endonuclease signature motif containing protein [Haloarcula argentinensis]|uniref:HNH endonuclease n=1 Tax=Haloarcula argentinensis TaxID=43776 RepID=A0ABU2F2L1_HALAR|nr:HNH endonuclease [Haloarcula argentinensis]EMA19928.1 hypothetical protein C443_13867 [Haloarcula argentinensis DSM 12282]MDS0254795.1 HNH endonuclease [Haloarcula argentinensis]